MPWREQSPRGFTLIELLVVISIIALLIGILIPSLGAARDEARRVLCLSNLRSLGQMTALYRNDHEDDEIPVMREVLANPLPPPEQIVPARSDFPDEDAFLKAWFEYYTIPRIYEAYGDAPPPQYDETREQWRASQPWACPQDRGRESEDGAYVVNNSTSYYYTPGVAVSSLAEAGTDDPADGIVDVGITGKTLRQVWEDWVPVTVPDTGHTVDRLPVMLDLGILDERGEWHQGGTRFDRGAQALFIDGSVGWNNVDVEDFSLDGPIAAALFDLIRRAGLEDELPIPLP